MRHSPESNIEHTHVYLQRGKGQVLHQSHENLVQDCVKSLEKHLFVSGKSFKDATPEDINVNSSSMGLVRHERKNVPLPRLLSFWTKGFSIPPEFLPYYPPLPVLSAAEEIDCDSKASDEVAKKKRRKASQPDRMKIVQKHLTKHTPAVSVSSNSIARFFKSPNSIVSNTPASIPIIKASSKPMAFHELPVTTPSSPTVDHYEYDAFNEEPGIASDVDGDDHLSIMNDTILALGRGSSSNFLREDSAFDENKSSPIGKDSALVVEKDSVPLGADSALLVQQVSVSVGVTDSSANDKQLVVPPPIPKGHVVLRVKGNGVTTRPTPSLYGGIMPTTSTTSELLPRPGVGCCNFCGSSTRHCKLICSGCNMSSCPTKHLMYSFPWRKKSCAIDSVGSCLQMLYTSNLNTEGKEIFGEYCPDLCELFTDLTSGLLATFKAKERLEQLLGDRLWTNQNAFWKFRNHNYEDIDKAFQLYQIRPPTTSSSSLPADEHSNIFTASITIADVCRTSGCSAYSVANYEHRILE